MEAFAVRWLFRNKLLHIFQQPANLSLYSRFANLLCCRFRRYLSYSRFMLRVRRQHRINFQPRGILGFSCRFLGSEALRWAAWSVPTKPVPVYSAWFQWSSGTCTPLRDALKSAKCTLQNLSKHFPSGWLELFLHLPLLYAYTYLNIVQFCFDITKFRSYFWDQDSWTSQAWLPHQLNFKIVIS